MVTSYNETQEQGEIVREMKGRVVILDQKLYRTERDIEFIKKDIQGLDNKIDNLHKETISINGLLTENRSLEEKLANENYGVEEAFNNELKVKQIIMFRN